MRVILDAIIPREDFEINNPETSTQGTSKGTIDIRDLEDNSFFLSAIKKPDFQRETNEWTVEKIISLVESFIKGDLIPAIILWRNPTNSYTFVIDGSHRLSALAAWVNDDYGDGPISKRFFDGIVPEEQLKIADKTRIAVRKRIGNYSDYKLALTDPDKVKPEVVQGAKALASQGVQLQWVNGDAHKAEESFFKINQNAAPINKTELRLLRSRKKPQGIASRAISRSGTGHKYWSNFTPENQEEVEAISKEINEMLFTPPLKNPIKTLDLPVGGKLYSQQTLALILEFIIIANQISDEVAIGDDVNGDETVKLLNKSRTVAQRLNSIHPSSLGLHPAIYLYSLDGRYKPASFYAITLFVSEISRSPKKLEKFTRVRGDFEQFLIDNSYVTEQIIRKWRSAGAGYPHVSEFYQYVIDLLDEGSTQSDIVKRLGSGEYSYIRQPAVTELMDNSEFSREAKSAIFIKEALGNAVKCAICKGYIHTNSLTFDHIARKQDGGLGTVDNGQLAHPYCNSTYKN